MLIAGALTANAQSKEKTVYEFQPHWYVGVQGGAQYTLGEVSFGDLISPTAQVLVGYNFSKVVGLRLGVNAWQSKAGLTGNYGLASTPFEYTWKWNYVAPNLDVTFNLSNLISGFNPCRLVDISAYLGVGANIAFNNGAVDVANEISLKYPNWKLDNGQVLGHVWDGTRAFVQGRAGVMVDFKVSKRVNVGLEVNANCLSDHYNSKHAKNADWYFNALAGVKIALGKTCTKKTIAPEAPETIYVDKIVEKVVEKKVVDKSLEVTPIRREIFFTICSTGLTIAEEARAKDILDYMKKYPQTKCEITGYADKGTGKPAGNLKLSQKRAEIVKKYLVDNGIEESRITTAYKGDTEQPFDINDLNRVSICIAQ